MSSSPPTPATQMIAVSSPSTSSRVPREAHYRWSGWWAVSSERTGSPSLMSPTSTKGRSTRGRLAGMRSLASSRNPCQTPPSILTGQSSATGTGWKKRTLGQQAPTCPQRQRSPSRRPSSWANRATSSTVYSIRSRVPGTRSLRSARWAAPSLSAKAVRSVSSSSILAPRRVS